MRPVVRDHHCKQEGDAQIQTEVRTDPFKLPGIHEVRVTLAKSRKRSSRTRYVTCYIMRMRAYSKNSNYGNGLSAFQQLQQVVIYWCSVHVSCLSLSEPLLMSSAGYHLQTGRMKAPPLTVPTWLSHEVI